MAGGRTSGLAATTARGAADGIPTDFRSRLQQSLTALDQSVGNRAANVGSKEGGGVISARADSQVALSDTELGRLFADDSEITPSSNSQVGRAAAKQGELDNGIAANPDSTETPATQLAGSDGNGQEGAGDLSTQQGQAIQTSRENQVGEAMVGGRNADGTPKWSTSTKLLVLGGVGLGAYVTYLGAMTGGTNGVCAKITRIVVDRATSLAGLMEDKNSKFLTIYFNRSEIYYPEVGSIGTCSNNKNIATGTFNPSYGDYIRLKNAGVNAAGATESPSTYKVREATRDYVKIKVPNSDLINFRVCAQTSPPSPCLDTSEFTDTESPNMDDNQYPLTFDFDSASTAKMQVFTSFTNQWADSMADGLLWLADIGANLAGNLLGPLALAGLNAAAGAAGAAGRGFCSIVPILCDKSFWLMVLFGVIGLIIIIGIS